MKTFKLVSILIFVLGGAAILVAYVQKRTESITLAATEMPEPYEIQEFKLTRTSGEPLTPESFKGKYTVLYFGFTQCPDACPTTLAQWRSEIPKLSADARNEVQFLLVSVDPERDTPEVLKRYVDGFSPDIQSAVGDQKETMKLAESMKTHFHKEDSTAGETDLYMMAHSPRYFLINPEAKLQAVYNPPLVSGALANDLNRLVERKKGGLFL